MYPLPTGPVPSGQECRALDDEFFTSDPNRYFRSRIDALLDWSEQPQTPPTQERSRFLTALGEVGSAHHPVQQRARRLQVALDAVQVRHHAAEALLRLLDAALHRRTAPSPSSLWLTLVDGPINLQDVLKRMHRHIVGNGFEGVAAGLLLPLPTGTLLSEEKGKAVESAWEWVGRAEELVSTGRLHLSGANNKIKHGIAVRPDDATKITFTTEPPDEKGNVRLSSLRQGVDLFDSPFLEYISRPPRPSGVAEPVGFERTWLRVDTPVVLAEAWMLAMVHGAVFSTMAYRHFGDKFVEGVPPYPGAFIGPSPSQVQGGAKSVVGARFPLTTSASGRLHRPAGVAFADGSFIPWTMQESTSAVVVEG